MTDEIPIGPNRCFGCGGEYGVHDLHCLYKPQQTPTREQLVELIKKWRAREAECARLADYWESRACQNVTAEFRVSRDSAKLYADELEALLK